ncbi:MAG: hypothetical protein JXQ87_05240 [Bacteroidia bacterium]
MSLLETEFFKLCNKYSNNQGLIAELWLEIEKAHSAKNRHYHNLKHLAYMLNLALEFKDKLQDFDAVLFSIFYHDFVYNVKRQDNEQKSAEVARDRLFQLNVPKDKIKTCQNQIAATKAHELSAHDDTNYLLDIDLAILGDSEENYKGYVSKVRKEYSIYPDFMYKMGRKKVLKHFLEMDRIFKTQEFHESHERLAKKNLSSELEKLK